MQRGRLKEKRSLEASTAQDGWLHSLGEGKTVKTKKVADVNITHRARIANQASCTDIKTGGDESKGCTLREKNYKRR